MVDLSKIDPSKVNIKHTYVNMTPEQTAYYKEQAELEDRDKELVRAEARRKHEKHMREGTPPDKARWVLTSERHRQGLSDEDIMARSGLDATALQSMYGLDARPTIETMEAYARALGKKLLIVLAEDGNA
ncbi:MAG: hypothetical protein ETSY1_31880 [Candidatus Entotheonella factor]|uniref:Uncharacterized protein n=1 Tax=Entotheonella factor TaxID=1429438 RepID=W4LCT4_ENTF1|nr:MAG: hypothetical protein ETSY1_31880 [Candidatus Entotheonella factor]